MSNKSWLLSAAAIRVAKECIKNVEEELGVRLNLTHPDFLQMLNDYSEMCDSETLSRHVQALNKFAAGETVSEAAEKSSVVALKANGTNANRVVSRVPPEQPSPSSTVAPPPAPAAPVDEQEYVEYNGKKYQRFRDGKEFKGLYRGAAKYA